MRFKAVNDEEYVEAKALSAKTRWLPAIAALVVVAGMMLAGGGVTQAQGDSRFFPPTGKTVKGLFLKYWDQNGALPQQGYPITNEFQHRSETDGKTYTMQCFERAVFENHPENVGKPSEVLLSLLGNFYYKQRYQFGAPANQKASTINPRFFSETGHTIGGKFRDYWEKNGGLAQQGFPITDEFQEKSDTDGKTYTVQYFERAVFELHPENAGTPYEVLLSLLGTFLCPATAKPTPTATVQPQPTLIRTITGHTDVVYDVAFSPDGKRIITASADKTVKVLNASDGSQISHFDHPDEVVGVAYSPDGKTIATGAGDGNVRLWDAGTGALTRTLTGHAGAVYRLAFSPDGKTLASGSADKTAKLWNVGTGALIRTLTGHTDEVNGVVFSPDGQRIITASADKTVKLWRVSDGSQISHFDQTSQVDSVAYSPDGQIIATGSEDGKVTLWNAGTGALIRTLTGHTGAVAKVAFSPDGKSLASGSADKTARLWNVSDGASISTITGHTDIVFSVAFSPDGSTLVTASADKTVKVWKVK